MCSHAGMRAASLWRNTKPLPNEFPAYLQIGRGDDDVVDNAMCHWVGCWLIHARNLRKVQMSNRRIRHDKGFQSLHIGIHHFQALWQGFNVFHRAGPFRLAAQGFHYRRLEFGGQRGFQTDQW